MTLLPFFEWCESSALGEFIRSSLWLFPAIECVHLIGLVVLGGAVLLVDLRLLGLGLRDEAVDRLLQGIVGSRGHELSSCPTGNRLDRTVKSPGNLGR